MGGLKARSYASGKICSLPPMKMELQGLMKMLRALKIKEAQT